MSKKISLKRNATPSQKALPMRALGVTQPNTRKQLSHRREIDLDKYSKNRTKNPFSIPLRLRVFNKYEVKRSHKLQDLPSEEIKTVKDMHDKFFKIVDGRPIRNYQDLQSYKRNIANTMLFRANAAYLRDDVKKIDDFLASDEVKAYNKVLNLYNKTKANFELFLSESYEEMKIIAEQQAKCEEKLRAATIEFEKVNYEYFIVSSHLRVLLDRFEQLKTYQDFVNKISPLYWRLENKIGFFGKSRTFTSIFSDSSCCSSDTINDEDNDDSDSDIYKKTVSMTKMNMMPCKLYFQKPEDLMNIFESIVEYCFQQMKLTLFYTEKIELKPIEKKRDQFKINLLKFTLDNFMKYEVNIFKKNTKFLEEKENFLKTKFFRIINNDFRETVVSDDSLKLFLYLQYLHEKLFTDVKSDTNDSSFVLMTQIENKYMEYYLKIDDLDYSIVRDISTKLMKEDRERMKKALFAQRALRECAVFTKSLQTSFEPPRYKSKNKQYY